MLKSEVTAAYGDKIYKIQIFVVCRHDGCKIKKREIFVRLFTFCIFA